MNDATSAWKNGSPEAVICFAWKAWAGQAGSSAWIRRWTACAWATHWNGTAISSCWRTCLEDVQWADWDRQGRLLVATRCGTLQILNLSQARIEIVFEEDLSLLEPKRTHAPRWATHW